MNKLNLTDGVLNKLGFSEYVDGAGDFGSRALTFKDGHKIIIWEIDEKEDDTDGYSIDGKYVSNHYCGTNWNALFFLHDIYEEIITNHENYELEFIDICRSIKMDAYIYDYIKEQNRIKETLTDIIYALKTWR